MLPPEELDTFLTLVHAAGYASYQCAKNEKDRDREGYYAIERAAYTALFQAVVGREPSESELCAMVH
jgi:hypothetical protein